MRVPLCCALRPKAGEPEVDMHSLFLNLKHSTLRCAKARHLHGRRDAPKGEARITGLGDTSGSGKIQAQVVGLWAFMWQGQICLLQASHRTYLQSLRRDLNHILRGFWHN